MSVSGIPWGKKITIAGLEKRVSKHEAYTKYKDKNATTPTSRVEKRHLALKINKEQVQNTLPDRCNIQGKQDIHFVKKEAKKKNRIWYKHGYQQLWRY